jgi:hypothetical protein
VRMETIRSQGPSCRGGTRRAMDASIPTRSRSPVAFERRHARRSRA